MNGSSAYGASKKYTDEHGGGTGTNNYEELSNKPSINGKTLVGNKTLDELGITNKFLSIERLANFLYKITFDSIPEYKELSLNVSGACSSFVRNGKLYRNFDYKYDNRASFRVITKDFEGMGAIDDVDDGSIDKEKIEQLPYHIADGVNRDGIMVSEHILYNDFDFLGSGSKNKDMTTLPFVILSNLHRISDITTNETILNFLANIKITNKLMEHEYLLQYLVTDGITTYAILPPTSASGTYQIVDITSNPKMTNFRWVDSATVVRTDLQNRPNGVERWNEIDDYTELSDLRFTKCYEAPTRLSDFIGERGTTRDSTDQELTEIYNEAHTMYESRTRDGSLWQTTHSVIYGKNGMESLFIQENFNKDYVKDIITNLFLFTYEDGTTSLEKMIKGE